MSEPARPPPHVSTVELFNSLAWFAMDGCWLAGWPWLSAAFCVPMLGTGLLILARAPRAGTLAVDGALLCWMIMNSLWMAGDQFALPALVDAARVVFPVGGLLLLGVALSPHHVGILVERFRRFRAPGT